jgi:hypothetical protein
VRTPSTTAPDFDSCSGATALARRAVPLSLLGVSTALVVVAATLLFASNAIAGKGIVGSFGGAAESPPLNGPQGIAVNNSAAGGVPAGTIYVVGNRQIDRYAPGPQWVSRWGWNVTGINEQQRITIGASGGTFTLTVNGQTTKALAFNVSGANAATAVAELPSIGAANVTGTNATGPPATITLTFTGARSGTDIPQITANGAGLEGTDPATGGSPSISTETLIEGKGGNFVGYEICTVATLCAPGGSPVNAAAATNGAFSPNPDGARQIAIDQGTGEIYVTDRGYNRVQKFDAVGNPLLVFGRNVNATTPSTATEVCTVASGNTCTGGTEGTLGGEFRRPGVGQGNGVGVVQAGPTNEHNVIVSDLTNGRIQEFTSGGVFVRAFGWDVINRTKLSNDPNNEVQQVKIPASSGTFTLKFGANTTAALPFNVPASGGVGPTASVQNALNALTSVSTGGGSVTVTGGPGDATGSTPYVVTFSGGPRSDADVAQIEVNGRGLGTAVGATLKCVGPTNTQNFVMTTEYQWLRNGQPIAGATSQNYQVTAADEGAAVQCQESSFLDENTAGPGRGSTQVSVPAINVTPLPGTARPVPPAIIPDVTGTLLPGQSNGVGEDGGFTLHCNPGTWTGSPTFTYRWYRSGVPLAGGTNKDYVVQPKDLATEAIFQCSVTGTNGGGSVTLVSGDPNFGGPSKTSPEPNFPGPPNPEPSAAQIPDLAVVTTTVVGAKFEVCVLATDCQAGVFGTATGQFSSNSPSRIAVDSTGAVYATDASGNNARVQKISQQAGSPPLVPSVFGTDVPDPPGMPNTHTNDFNIMTLAMGPSDHLLVQKESATGFTPVCLDGTPSKFERRVQELASDGSSVLDTHGVCSGISTTESLRGLGYNGATGDIYLIADPSTVYILNGGAGTDPSVSIDDPVQTATTAVVTGAVNPNPTPSTYPNPPKTSWRLQYKESSSGDWIPFRTPTDVGSGSGNVPYRTTLTPLLPNTSYDVRVVATKQFNSAQGISSVETFTTAKAPPAILSARSRHVSATDADLEASIDPRGTDTSYFFEWGTTPNYGNVTPVEGVGDGQGAEQAFAHITGLSDVTYHFRVIAENEAGTVVGENQSFTFHPPQCPNSLVRQQTGAGYLPDCRAFELVSHSDAGNSVINSFTGPHSPVATSPSRIGYMAMFAPLPEQGNPPNNFDLYLATRTSEGWVTKYIGLDATEAFGFGGPPGPTGTAGYLFTNVIPVTPDMSKILLWDLGNPEILPPSFSNAPYVFGADGDVIERWPTNLSEIAGGEDFNAQNYQLLSSGDLTHFYFTSDVPFLPGASATAIYDNDIEAGTLEIASKDPSELDFTGYPIQASTDGSHLLMSTATLPICLKTPCAAIPPADLYMRVDGSHTYDVTGGYNGTYAGMNSDGSRVFFTSTEPVTGGETDTSLDLYMWEEATDSITRVSAGGAGTGDTDDCNPVSAWTSKCGIKLIRTYEQKCGGSGLAGNCDTSNPKPQLYNGNFNFKLAASNGHPADDTAVAAAGEEIYFYSPEKLDGPTKGAEGLPNLYVLHDGHAQFVATFNPDPACRQDTSSFGGSGTLYCAAGPIGRIQVTRDGGFVAFTSHEELTGYDANGHEEMFRYSPGDDNLVCVSCLPDGSVPTSSVDGSQNGLFLTEDGRTFFTTNDAVQPDDTNKAQDVYEYVDGRPQLITGGTGSTREPLCTQCGLGQFSRPGLIGVSADGLDVFFGTYDVITPQDHNGRNLKIYDARTGGGFVNVAVPQPCQAADECHAPASTPTGDAPAATGTHLGDNGNFSSKAEKRKAQKSRKRKRQKKKRARERKSKAAQHRNTGRNHG